MKILRKGDEFRKLPEITIQDVLIIKKLINQGWSYSSKKEFKEFNNKNSNIKK